MICLLFMTDGRDDLLGLTVASAQANLDGAVTRGIIHTDNGGEHRELLAHRFPRMEVIGGQRVGFGGAIDRAWRYVAENVAESFVFACEDDFTFNRNIDLDAMSDVLVANPHIAQMALRRQAWNDDERRAGGVVELHPSAYTECNDERGNAWLEHRQFWTTNVSLFRASRCAAGWPTGEHSEGIYGLELFSDPEVVCAYWGARDSGEAVRHVGEVRVGRSY